MNIPIEFDPDAQADFDDSADWCGDEAPELKLLFSESVETILSIVSRSPQAFPVVYGSNARRAVVRGFPYAIFFTPEDEKIVVHAIFHTSRNPIAWRGRIG